MQKRSQIHTDSLKSALRVEKVEMVTGIIDNEIVPYLIHFSKMGIVAKIVGVKTPTGAKVSEVRMIRVYGPRLDYLIETRDLKALIKVYQKLGTDLGYMFKYDVSHNDLHTNNVAVKSVKPFIIDWDEAMLGIKSCDDLHLLNDTEIVLKSCNRFYLYHDLEKTFRTAFNEEGSRPTKVTHDEIRDAAFKEFGFISTP